MFKLDLHTHSVNSPDGGITATQYQRALDEGLIDFVAVTDHNRIDAALHLQQQLGDRVIIGEEIMTNGGEIIGLYLTEAIPSGLTPLQTMQLIKQQNGIVYIPHPFETVRKGLHPATVEELVEFVDIIEVCNGRAFLQNRSEQAVVWSRMNQVPGAASSDAHGYKGLGHTYTRVAEPPTRDNLVDLISIGIPITGRPNLKSLLYPKYHKLRKKVRKTS